MLVCKMQLSPSGMHCGAKINFITVLFFHTAPLHFMENKAHFVPLIRLRKVQYKAIEILCNMKTVAS